MDKLLYQIYLFNVNFKSGNGEKERPIVSVVYHNELITFELLAVYSDKPKFSSNPFYEDFMYPVRDWKSAGLHKSSWIDVSEPIKLPLTALMGKQSFGRLSEYDAKNLMKIYHDFWANHGE
jgi:hypothetical protein